MELLFKSQDRFNFGIFFKVDENFLQKSYI